jgi:hypothetical protein
MNNLIIFKLTFLYTKMPHYRERGPYRMRYYPRFYHRPTYYVDDGIIYYDGIPVKRRFRPFRYYW